MLHKYCHYSNPCCTVHLRYNVLWKYPDAYERLDKYKCYEDKEYSEDENGIKMAKLLLCAPEIKRKWMKMHSDSFLF